DHHVEEEVHDKNVDLAAGMDARSDVSIDAPILRKGPAYRRAAASAGSGDDRAARQIHDRLDGLGRQVFAAQHQGVDEIGVAVQPESLRYVPVPGDQQVTGAVSPWPNTLRKSPGVPIQWMVTTPPSISIRARIACAS